MPAETIARSSSKLGVVRSHLSSNLNFVALTVETGSNQIFNLSLNFSFLNYFNAFSLKFASKISSFVSYITSQFKSVISSKAFISATAYTNSPFPSNIAAYCAELQFEQSQLSIHRILFWLQFYFKKFPAALLSADDPKDVIRDTQGLF